MGLSYLINSVREMVDEHVNRLSGVANIKGDAEFETRTRTGATLRSVEDKGSDRKPSVLRRRDHSQSHGTPAHRILDQLSTLRCIQEIAPVPEQPLASFRR